MKVLINKPLAWLVLLALLILLASTPSLTFALRSATDSPGSSLSGIALEPVHDMDSEETVLSSALPAPGGIDSNLALWLKADSGVTESGGAVSQWDDQSSNGFSAQQGTSANQPTLVAESINFNPTVRLDGTNDDLTISGGILGANTYNDLNVYAVSTADVSQESVFFKEAASPLHINAHIPWVNDIVYWDAGSTGAVHRLSAAWGGQHGTPYIWSFLYSTSTTANGQRQEILRDGNSLNQDTSASAFTGTNSDFFVGSNGDGTWYHDGDIAELIFYSGNIDSATHNRIQSYLAAKYGITLGSTSNPMNYVNSGGTIIWSGDGTYQNDVAGIARDDDSGLNQAKSKSINSDALVTIEGTLGTNLSALLWGNNDGSINAFSATGAPASRQILARTWKVAEQSETGNVTLSVPDDGSAASTKLPAEQNVIYLLQDADGDFSSGATESTLTLTSGSWEGSVNLQDGEFFTFATDSSGPLILRVDDNSVAGSPDGSTWANAYPKLQDALAVATSGDEIWVAAGIYYPDEGSGQTNDAQTSTFQLKNGVAIYGGFNGTETARADADWETNVTVLSGDIDQNDTNKDANGIISSTDDIVGSNAYHVVIGSGTDSTAILDGVTINAGQANGASDPDDRGGGVHNNAGSPTLSNLNITSNSASFDGGGMYNLSSNPTLTNVTITSNSGGMYNSSSSPTLTNVTITSNSARVGGGMFNFASHPTLTNVTISGNSASNDGGGMYNFGSHPTLTNVTISGNSASNDGGGMSTFLSNPTLSNVIIWNNEANGDTTSTSASIADLEVSTPNISYSLIANSGGSGSWNTDLGTDGGNNIDADPKFVTDGDPSTTPPTAGDYRLQKDSAAIDMGKVESCPEQDIRGEARDDLACDMGAYEFVGSDGMEVVRPIAGTGTYTFGPTLVGAEITDDGSGCLTGLTIEEVAGNHPQAPEGLQTGKYWNISPTGCTTGFSVNLTLPHTDTISAADARACRYDGSTWDCGDSGNNNSTNSRVTRNGVSEFSPWAVGNASLPLAVNLASFTADASLDDIRLEWATVSELENLGFNLYRATTPEGSFGQTQLNSELIPSQVPGSGTGAAYEWLDSDVEADTTYYYWLEDVDIHGTSTMHGPLSVTSGTPTAVSLQALRSHQSGEQMWLLLVGVLGVMGLVAWWRFGTRTGLPT